MDKLFEVCGATGAITFDSLGQTSLGLERTGSAPTLTEAITRFTHTGKRRWGAEEEEEEASQLEDPLQRNEVLGETTLYSALTAMWDAIKEVASGHGSADAWRDALAYLW